MTKQNTWNYNVCKLIGVDEPDLKVAFRLGNQKERVIRPLKVVMNNKKYRKTS